MEVNKTNPPEEHVKWLEDNGFKKVENKYYKTWEQEITGLTPESMIFSRRENKPSITVQFQWIEDSYRFPQNWSVLILYRKRGGGVGVKTPYEGMRWVFSTVFSTISTSSMQLMDAQASANKVWNEWWKKIAEKDGKGCWSEKREWLYTDETTYQKLGSKGKDKK